MKLIIVTFVLCFSMNCFGNDESYEDFFDKCIRGFDEMLIDGKTPIGKCRLDCGCGYFSMECHQKCLQLHGKPCTEADVAIRNICLRKCGPFKDGITRLCMNLCYAQCAAFSFGK